MCEIREKISEITNLPIKEIDERFNGLINESNFFDILNITIIDVIRHHLKLDIRENLLREYNELKKIDHSIIDLDVYANEEIEHSQPKFIDFFCEYYFNILLVYYENNSQFFYSDEESLWFKQELGQRIFNFKSYFADEFVPILIHRDFIIKFLF